MRYWKIGARVLAHQDGVGGIVVDAELIAHAVLLRDPVQGDPGAGHVRDVVHPQVGGVPARHGALLHAELQAAVLGGLEQGDEFRFEKVVVLVHAELDVAAHEAAYRLDAQGDRRVHGADHELALLEAVGVVVREHVVEVGDVGHAHAGFLHGRQHAVGALGVEGLAQVQGVGHRIEHGLGGHVGFAGVQGGGKLDVFDVEFAGELEPILDGPIRIRIAHVAGSEFLERGGEHAHLHEFRFECFHGHGVSFFSESDPRRLRLGIRRAAFPAPWRT